MNTATAGQHNKKQRTTLSRANKVRICARAQSAGAAERQALMDSRHWRPALAVMPPLVALDIATVTKLVSNTYEQRTQTSTYLGVTR